jgi:hypothetical protein
LGSFKHFAAVVSILISDQQKNIYSVEMILDIRSTQNFSPGIPVSSTNKTDRHDLTEILLKVVLNTINLT